MEPWMAEMAEEELRALEAEHPDRFDHLKLELKEFISHAAFSSPPGHTDASSAYISTQVSSNGTSNKRKGTRRSRKKKKGSSRGAQKERKPKRSASKRKDSADLAMERAEECLRKIRRLKELLLASNGDWE